MGHVEVGGVGHVGVGLCHVGGGVGVGWGCVMQGWGGGGSCWGWGGLWRICKKNHVKVVNFEFSMTDPPSMTHPTPSGFS